MTRVLTWPGAAGPPIQHALIRSSVDGPLGGRFYAIFSSVRGSLQDADAPVQVMDNEDGKFRSDFVIYKTSIVAKKLYDLMYITFMVFLISQISKNKSYIFYIYIKPLKNNTGAERVPAPETAPGPARQFIEGIYLSRVSGRDGRADSGVASAT